MVCWEEWAMSSEAVKELRRKAHDLFGCSTEDIIRAAAEVAESVKCHGWCGHERCATAFHIASEIRSALEPEGGDDGV